MALGVRDVDRCIADYSQRLGCPPEVHVPGEYALWRSAEVNLSLRRAATSGLRHLGWEDPSAPAFSSDTDVNGIVWERFAAEQQLAEIRELWPVESVKDGDVGER
ncbi:MAG TPA: hypothetical protein VN764_03925 [Polyangiaceae bacterium]|nr:hypothetical protein [Polyangiaceae bacterium]